MKGKWGERTLSLSSEEYSYWTDFPQKMKKKCAASILHAAVISHIRMIIPIFQVLYEKLMAPLIYPKC